MQKVFILKDIIYESKSVFNPELRIGFKEEPSSIYLNPDNKEDKKYCNFLFITKDSGADNLKSEPDGVSLELTQDEAEFLYQALKKLKPYFKLVPTTKDYAASP